MKGNRQKKEREYIKFSMEDLKDENIYKRLKWTLDKVKRDKKQGRSEKLFFDLKEINDQEGEVWHFYCSYEKKEAEEVEKLLDIIDQALRSDDHHWTINRMGLKESYIKQLIENCDDKGYMFFHNKREHVTAKQLKKLVDCKECLKKIMNGEHGWYKGTYHIDCECLLDDIREESEESDDDEEEDEENWLDDESNEDYIKEYSQEKEQVEKEKGIKEINKKRKYDK
jgi:hypothetical protein